MHDDRSVLWRRVGMTLFLLLLGGAIGIWGTALHLRHVEQHRRAEELHQYVVTFVVPLVNAVRAEQARQQALPPSP